MRKLGQRKEMRGGLRLFHRLKNNQIHLKLINNSPFLMAIQSTVFKHNHISLRGFLFYTINWQILMSLVPVNVFHTYTQIFHSTVHTIVKYKPHILNNQTFDSILEIPQTWWHPWHHRWCQQKLKSRKSFGWLPLCLQESMVSMTQETQIKKQNQNLKNTHLSWLNPKCKF